MADQGTVSCMEEMGGEGNTHSTGSGVENQSHQSVLHRGASLPSHRSISLRQAWKNPDPGFNSTAVFKARNCRVPAGPTSSSFPCYVLLLAAQIPKQTHPGRAVDTHMVPVHTLTRVDRKSVV